MNKADIREILYKNLTAKVPEVKVWRQPFLGKPSDASQIPYGVIKMEDETLRPQNTIALKASIWLHDKPTSQKSLDTIIDKVINAIDGKLLTSSGIMGAVQFFVTYVSSDYFDDDLALNTRWIDIEFNTKR